MFTTLLDLIFPPRNDELLVRRATNKDIENLLDPVIRNEIISLLPFKDPLISACVHECKYYKNKKAIALLGHALSLFLTDWFVEHQEFEEHTVLTYIPLSTNRQKQRGYNQVEEILGASGWKYSSVLEKVRDTISQTKLSRRERLENQKQAFIAHIQPHTSYIVTDDVTTTGATLQSAKDSIETQGAKAICISLAH